MTWELIYILSIVWWIFPIFAWFMRKLIRPLPSREKVSGFVSVIVPARNEAKNIERCIRSLGSSQYDDFEIIVVDDRSEDNTAALARKIGPGRAKSLQVVEGAELPFGWVGKSWACHQGAAKASGNLLLFTDADTYHTPQLLGQAVAGMEDDQAHVLSVVGQQEMRTFWERKVQPQILFLMRLVYCFVLRRPFKQKLWRWAVAIGQFLLVRKDVYNANGGGHELVKGDVVEDVRYAQIMTRKGYTVAIRSSDNLMIRMYHSLREMVNGYSKNVYTASKHLMGAFLGPIFFVFTIVPHISMWALPIFVLLITAVLGLNLQLLFCMGSLYLAGIFAWSVVSRHSGLSVNLSFISGLLHPLGAGVVGYIFFHSMFRSTRVRWKNRKYQNQVGI